MKHIKKIHFIGIGGSGMGGIAEILIHEGYQISGSDMSSNSVTTKLINLGAKIFFNHHPNNINKANVIVISSAIASDNPEIIAAKKACIPVIQRAEMLSEIMRFRYGIAISGTHGKTTTTSMLISIYYEAGLDPTFVNGGLVKSEESHAHLGFSQYLIVEADESDASFLYLKPMIAIITNIEQDHMETYRGNFENLQQAFVNFLHNLPFYGRAVICFDDPVIQKLLSRIERKVTTYGFNKNSDVYLTNYRQKEEKGSFIIYRRNKPKLQINLNVPGYHNALNAAAAIAVATEDGIDDKNILQAMLNFKGTRRRFDNLGKYMLSEINGKIGEVILIDDYGHHPTEIEVTIKTIRAGWPEKRLIMIFQPHRYTRTRDLYKELINALSNVDLLLMLDVYSSGEIPISGADSQSLCQNISAKGKMNPILISNIKELIDILVSIMQDNDLILMQGAGTIGKIARQLADILKSYKYYNQKT